MRGAKRAVLLSALLGVALPVLLQFVRWTEMARAIGGLDGELTLDRVALVLWPSSIFLLASDNPSPLGVDGFLLYAIAANVILYIAVGSLLWAAMRRTRVAWVPLVLIVGLICWRMLTL